MLLSIALIIIFGTIMGNLCKRVKLPALLGMLVTGIILGPYLLNMLDPKILNISPEIRKIALIIILTRAGLSLDISGLKKLGRPALLMCFLPASFELLGTIIFAPRILGVTYLEAAIIGATLAAVSPAVVVPRMIKLINEGYGKDKGIPQMVLAGASVDDVYVIVLFTTFIGMIQGKSTSIVKFINIPVSVFLGIIIGLIVGNILERLFKYFNLNNITMVLMLLSTSFILVSIEDRLKTDITFSALIAVMFIGVGLSKRDMTLTEGLSLNFGKLWVIAEIFLFVLVGASINIQYFGKFGLGAILLVFLALIVRMVGVFFSILGTNLDKKEKLFTMIAYTPKATVQAAIGGIPLTLGLACGDTVLTVAVISIILTAPLGAFFIDLTYKKLLKK